MDPSVVVAALVKLFGATEKELNAEEKIIYSQIVSLLDSNMMVVEDIRTLGFGGDDGSDNEMDFADSDDNDDHDELLPSQGSQRSRASQPSSSGSEYVESPKKKARILDDEYKEKAFLYWATDKQGNILEKGKRKPHRTVFNQFKLLKSMNPIYDWEERRSGKRPTMRMINEAVMTKFKESVKQCAVIHDRTIRIWAMRAKAAIDPDDTLRFKASISWVKKFKKRNQIVSRAITHRVSRNWQSIEADLHVQADEFVTSMRQLIIDEDLEAGQVMNADQSRFEKELHSYRTLRPLGIRAVRASVGSVSATTHSYMIMPVVSMGGEIMRPMYVLVAEASGKFPASKPADPPNIKSFAGKTANMNKADLLDFYKQAMWPSIPAGRGKVLLLLDSWSANKDNSLSDSCIPERRQLIKRLIPGGCTGMIQPLDVFFFRPYKSFVRFITDTVIVEEDVNIWHRDKFLALQSFTLYQFSAARFQNMVKYAFYKAGYLAQKPEAWISPHDYCFDSIVNDKCFKCESIAFVKCAHCEQSICLTHAMFSELHIDCI